MVCTIGFGGCAYAGFPMLYLQRTKMCAAKSTVMNLCALFW